MTSAQPTSPPREEDDLVWGAAPPHRGWSKGQTLAAVGIAAVIAAFGGAAIYAATGSGSNSNAMGPGMHSPRPGGRGGPGFGGQDALHGQYVLADGHGGYMTEMVQTGKVTAVSDTSITAKSVDGFTQTYTITSGSTAANSHVAVNDTVTVHATLADGTATATSVVEGAGPGQGGSGGPPGH
jgi:hypothetical protein